MDEKELLMAKERTCIKCHKKMREAQNFYTSRRTDLFPPDGIVGECKKCFTMHINIYEPSTFLDLLEKIDVPYIEAEWNILVERYGNNPKTTPTAIFGRYLAKMKLRQYCNFRFVDTERFVEEAKIREMREKSAKLAQINKYRDAQASGLALEQLQEIDLSKLTEEEKEELLKEPEELFDPEEINTELDKITKEDKQYLLQKWGRTYTIPECIKLEKLYNEMIDSYDIRTASHFDYLLKICRVSLKIDQALEINDIDGFQKMTKIYDLLMKSAKFTAAQNKEQSEDYTDAIGILVGLCEEEGFIPKYHNEERQDIVDYTLKDMNEYMRKLIMNEMNLGNMIEVYLQRMIQEENKAEDEMTEDDDVVILSEKEQELIQDSDYDEFNEMIDEEEELDEEMLKKSEDVI